MIHCKNEKQETRNETNKRRIYTGVRGRTSPQEPSLAQIMAERAIAQQKEADRRLAEEHDKEANTPEALAARDRVLAKFCK